MKRAEFLSTFLLSLQFSSLLGLPMKNEEVDSHVKKQLQIISTTQNQLQKSLSSMKAVLNKMATLIEDQIPQDCSGAKTKGDWNAFQKIKPPGHSSRKVRCDQFTAGGGWTVVVYRTAEHLFDKNKPFKFGYIAGSSRRRYNGLDGHVIPVSKSKSPENFNRTWSEYKKGFGSEEQEYWIGNEILHALTRDRPWEAIVVVEDWSGKEAHAYWKSFRISGEAERYQLEISGYDSSKSSLEDGLAYHGGRSFSTIDADNDDYEEHCAKMYGGGWWFNKCHVSHLTGTHLKPGTAGHHSVHWLPWKSSSETLKSASLMIRPPKPSPL